MMPQENRFEERYAKGDIPWDIGRVDANLVELVENRPVGNCRALDIGCGTGDNSLWLARRGFEVTGLDNYLPSLPIHESFLIFQE
ncbi:MAG: methyltransferase domain-containing protein [Chlorobiales bacterium]|nr:methyltransferase domain-containing protein [Chlorobiales bacterium]